MPKGDLVLRVDEVRLSSLRIAGEDLGLTEARKDRSDLGVERDQSSFNELKSGNLRMEEKEEASQFQSENDEQKTSVGAGEEMASLTPPSLASLPSAEHRRIPSNERELSHAMQPSSEVIRNLVASQRIKESQKTSDTEARVLFILPPSLRLICPHSTHRSHELGVREDPEHYISSDRLPILDLSLSLRVEFSLSRQSFEEIRRDVRRTSERIHRCLENRVDLGFGRGGKGEGRGSGRAHS